jgi:PBP superfamily domain
MKCEGIMNIMLIDPIKLAVRATLAAGLLCGVAATAANVNLYVSGSGGMRTMWKASLATAVCGANAIATYTIMGAAFNPDSQAYRCTAGAAPTLLPTGIAAGDQVTLHSSAELGSIWGIAPFLNNFGGAGYPTQRLFVNPDSPDCLGTVCNITAYNVATETFTSVSGTALVSHVPDVGLMEVDPEHYWYSENWDSISFPVLGPVPSAALAIAFRASPNSLVLNGAVFSVIVNKNGPLMTHGITGLSFSSLRRIFQGDFATWDKVPEVGTLDSAHTPIKLCRRNAGAGTQMAASTHFQLAEACGDTPLFASVTPGIGGSGPGNLTSIEELTNPSKLLSCVTGPAVGAIGIQRVNLNDTAYQTLTEGCSQPNAHNAASDTYLFRTESWLYNNTSVSGAPIAAKNLLNVLITAGRRATKMPVVANEAWNATTQIASPPFSRFALCIPGSGNVCLSSLPTETAVAVQLLGNYRSGTACLPSR